MRSGLESLLVRVAGSWTLAPPPHLAPPGLLIGAGSEERIEPLSETSGAAARAAPGERPFRATYSVPDELVAMLSEALLLDFGGVRLTLPEPEAAEGELPAGVQGNVVDRAELAERRAKRAEAAEESLAARASEAESALGDMELDLARLELQLRRAEEERDDLAERLARPPGPGATAQAPDGGTPAGATRGGGATPAETRGRKGSADDLDGLRERLEEAEAAVTRLARERVKLAEGAGTTAAPDDPMRTALRRERELLRTPISRPAAAQPVAASHPELDRAFAAAERRALDAVGTGQLEAAGMRAQSAEREAALREAETGVLKARSAVVALQAELEIRDATHDRLQAELEAVREELLVVRTATVTEADEQRAASERLVHEVVTNTIELREALVLIWAERDEARSDVARLEAQLQAEREAFTTEAARIEARLTELRAEVDAAVSVEFMSTASAALAEAQHRLRLVERRFAESREAAVRLAESLESEQRKRESLQSELEAALAAAEAPQAWREPAPPAASPEAYAEPTPAPAGGAWLGRGLRRLAGDDELAALRVLVDLLAASPGAPEEAEWDLIVPGHGAWAIAPSGVAALDDPRPQAAFWLQTDAAALIDLLADGPRGVSRRRARVRGTRRRRRALRAVGPVALDLGSLAEQGVLPRPRPLYEALVRLIDPEWTRGHSFCVRQEITGPRGESWYVAVDDGEPVRLVTEEPAAGATASIRASQDAFARLLSQRTPAAGEKVAMRGDLLALALLTQWTDRVQRGEGR